MSLFTTHLKVAFQHDTRRVLAVMLKVDLIM